MKPPSITCPTCAGTGHVGLQADYQRTLKLLQRAKSPKKAVEMAEEGITVNAINNRLSRLESLGLVKRTGKEGKFILWEAAKLKVEKES